MPLSFELHTAPTVPLEVNGLTPDVLQSCKTAEIERMTVQHGNRQVPAAEFFHVRGEARDGVIHWEGELRGVHGIGARMRAGALHVHGDAGRHLGAEMRGGEIVVEGDVSDWAGAEMRGGSIRVHGDAGDFAGGAYRGSRRGMKGGVLLIDGNAGREIGNTMRRGLLAVGGNVGDWPAMNMRAGTVVLMQSCGIRPAAGMRRGTLLFLRQRPRLLPTFRHACRCRLTAVALILRELRRHAFSPPDEILDAPLDLFNGDLLEGGRGEVFAPPA